MHCTLRTLRTIICCWLLLAAAGAAAQGATKGRLLWHIGNPGHGIAGFALAPSAWIHYRRDGSYVVGVSKRATDWPFVLPGPVDWWAGKRSHVGTILFGLAATPQSGSATLVIHLAGAQGSSPPLLSAGINGHHFTRQIPRGLGGRSPAAGKPYVWRIAFPAALLSRGLNTVTIRSMRGSWVAFGAVGLYAPAGLKVVPAAGLKLQWARWDNLALARGPTGQPMQALRLGVTACGVYGKALGVRVGDGPVLPLAPMDGRRRVRVLFPPARQAGSPPVQLLNAGKVFATLAPQRNVVPHRIVYVLPHSHVDVGYGYYQPTAIHLHHVYITKSLALARKTSRLPPAARFRWNLESLVELDGYLKGYQHASPAKTAAFIQAVRKGAIGLDGTYCNVLTGLCRPQDLISWLHFAHVVRLRYGLKIDSAMQCDVPGMTWGAVPVLADAGIRYMFLGPNGGQPGFSNRFSGRAFYWLSPSGTQKILMWQEAGYNYSSAFLSAVGVRPWLRWFHKMHPHNHFNTLYVMEGADNAPPPGYVSQLVQQWNKSHCWPRLVISTASHAARRLIAREGKNIPTYRGNYNGYWENGAASTPRVTRLSRNATEALAQAQVLWDMLDAGQYPHKIFSNAWQNTMMFDEHTWGSHLSWSHPHGRDTRLQWVWKKRYATRAMFQAQWLQAQAQRHIASRGITHTFAVFNTSSWTRTGLVRLSAAESRTGELVRDEAGKPVPSQRLADGSLVFIAADIPGMACRTFSLSPGKPFAPAQPVSVNAAGTVLQSGQEVVQVDPATGLVTRWTVGKSSANLVNKKDRTCRGLNDYLFVHGKTNKHVEYSAAPTIRVINAGPLVASVQISSAAPGCKKLVRTVEIVAGEPQINFRDMLNMPMQYPHAEAVHIGFNLAGRVVHYDTPLAVVNPQKDLLRNSNNNLFSVCRWVDVSGGSRGVTMATPDVPLLELGQITEPEPHKNSKWLRHPLRGGTLYSYLYNNYWHTNYKAYETGRMAFRYVLRAHAAYRQVAAEHFGIDAGQPLIAVGVAKGFRDVRFPLRWHNNAVLLAGCRPVAGGGYLVRLFNVSGKPAKVHLQWAGAAGLGVSNCGLFGGHRAPAARRFTMPALGLTNVVVRPL